VLLLVFSFSACTSGGKKTLNMSRVKRIEFTADRSNVEGCADPAEPSKRLPLGTKYCLNPTGNKGDGNL
jgi:hypothetical protein